MDAWKVNITARINVFTNKVEKEKRKEKKEKTTMNGKLRYRSSDVEWNVTQQQIQASQMEIL